MACCGGRDHVNTNSEWEKTFFKYKPYFLCIENVIEISENCINLVNIWSSRNIPQPISKLLHVMHPLEKVCHAYCIITNMVLTKQLMNSEERKKTNQAMIICRISLLMSHCCSMGVPIAKCLTHRNARFLRYAAACFHIIAHISKLQALPTGPEASHSHNHYRIDLILCISGCAINIFKISGDLLAYNKALRSLSCLVEIIYSACLIKIIHLE